MAEDAEAPAEEGADGSKKKKLPGKVLVLFVGAPVLVVILILVVLFVFMGGGEDKAGHHAEDHGGDHGSDHGDDHKAGHKGEHDDGHGGGHGEDHGDGHGEGHGTGHGADHGGGHAAAKIPPLKPEDAIFFDLPDILVNLNAPSQRATYLKLKVALELHKDADVQALDDALPRVIDRFQVYLREMRPEDLTGSAGLFRLKEELLRRVNVASYPVHVYNVLFKEMLIQ